MKQKTKQILIYLITKNNSYPLIVGEGTETTSIVNLTSYNRAPKEAKLIGIIETKQPFKFTNQNKDITISSLNKGKYALYTEYGLDGYINIVYTQPIINVPKTGYENSLKIYN